MTDCATKVDMLHEICTRLGYEGDVVVPKTVNERTQRIITHYQRTWNRSRRKSALYLDTLVQACISNLAGGNGVDNQRTEVRL